MKKGLIGLLGWLTISAASANPSYVLGPVERISVDRGEIDVLGQRYVIGPRPVGFDTQSLPSVGDFVAIASNSLSFPQTASSLVVMKTRYVPGASSVFVGGTVNKVSPEVGTVSIGELTVDVSSASADVIASLKIGSFVEISGIQPSPTGVLLGKEVETKTLSIGGTGEPITVTSIGETGNTVTLQSIGGTGGTATLQSIGGTGSSASLRSIGGTGGTATLQSIGGTGSSVSLRSIGGTGSTATLQSIGGTGSSVSLRSTVETATLQSIGGTGVTVAAKSIGGTGSNSSARSIGGTGVNATVKSIGGTGKALDLQRIDGTGGTSTIQSIGGTGIALE